MTIGLMIDCESLDTAPTAALLSVGIVVMNFDTLTLGPEFYLRIDADDCIKRGMTVSADTIRWWTEQDPAFLKAAFNRDLANPLPGFNAYNDYWNPLVLAIPKIMNFICEYPDAEVWACGGRDFEWLETAFRLHGAQVPWKYRSVRDYRTMREMFPTVKGPPDNAQPHNALADARWQAEHLLMIIIHIHSSMNVEEEL